MVNWCLILVLWGDKYTSGHVNQMVANVHRLSSTCVGATLMTDRIREGLDDRVKQVLISDEFNRTELKANYTIKLSLFDSRILADDLRCVYLDLDTVVTGDLAQIAVLVRERNDLFMLPPGSLLGFGWIRRLIFRITHGRRMAKGNSSILTFRSDMQPNLAKEFQRLKALGDVNPVVLANDDLFISWFGQARLKSVPTALGVMFRREFLTRFRWFGWIKNRLPWVRQRRDRIVAVTFNGLEHKLENLLQRPDGCLHLDSKGRFGYWSRAEMGPIKDKILRGSATLQRVDL
jgi:hypothetical protein